MCKFIECFYFVFYIAVHQIGNLLQLVPKKVHINLRPLMPSSIFKFEILFLFDQMEVVGIRHENIIS